MAKAVKSTTTSATSIAEQGGPSVEFVAEIRQVATRKTASLDLEHKVVLVSDDELVNTLGLVPADSLVKVRVEVLS